MKTTPALNKVLNGIIGAPTIVETKKDLLPELFPILKEFKLFYRAFPMFNMVSTFLTRKTITELVDLDIVEHIYVDWPVKLPEMPIGFSAADFLLQKGFFGLGVLQTGKPWGAESRENWITTVESGNYLGVKQARRENITGKNVKVAVVDSEGSLRAANHRQLLGKAVERYQVRLPAQTDTNGHGAHVATTICGMFYEPLPGFYVEGIAPDAHLIFVKSLLTPLGTGSTSDCIEGINIAVKRGAQVINLSLGSEATDPSEDPFVKIINSLPEHVIVCAASGNESAKKVGSPAIAEKALAIGALNNRTGLKADFSNSGPELDFCMPGVNIFSGLTRETLCDIVGGGPEGFSALSGTSMATPHMSGMVSLAIELMRQHDFIPTVETFREIGQKYGEIHNNDYGYGPLTYDMIKRYVQETLA
jgi:subtilisin family serine protease